MPRMPASTGRAAACVLLAALAGGCASSSIDLARTQFYGGRVRGAEAILAPVTETDRNAVLLLMERGTIRQAAHDYRKSNADWLEAVKLQEKFETMSATDQSASFVVNDKTVAFRGKPFERTLLRAFLAKNYFALGLWEDATVEARNIIKQLQNLNGYPDDPYSRYMAGFCLELAADPSNAALQYRNAAGLLRGIGVDENTGAIGPVAQVPTNAVPGGAAAPRPVPVKRPPPDPSFTQELVCFVMLGRSVHGSDSLGYPSSPPVAPYAEIFCNGKFVGRSYPFVDTTYLVAQTNRRRAALQAAKDIARIAVKETLTYQASRQDEGLGLVVGLLLFAFEQPDDRRWETLPQWLQIARVPCPPDLKSFRVVFKGPGGVVHRTMDVTEPITRCGRIYVSHCRDLPPDPSDVQPAAAVLPPR